MKYKKIEQIDKLPLSEFKLYEEFLNDLFLTFTLAHEHELIKTVKKSKLDTPEKDKLISKIVSAFAGYETFTKNLTLIQKDKLAVKTSIYLLNREILGQVRSCLASNEPPTDDETALNIFYFFETTSKYRRKFESLNEDLIISIKKLS
ncbi:hypothetical protein AS889_18110 [Pseudomonas putida]|uniref:hypothetical protein n=1 Tax=Pseudomonas putida TaxID=303 RepID=UPI0007716DAA|nr:hypothetical protein [Pseudomonas putida]KWW13567.1 hypothetical protein AS889_18110 [Pseudomonas putida]